MTVQSVSPQQAAPLSRRHHPAALLHFFDQPQQETIHPATCRSAKEKGKTTNCVSPSLCCPQLILARMISEQVTRVNPYQVQDAPVQTHNVELTTSVLQG